MTRRCELTAKSVLHGHNVSHSERKTKRTFLPNLQNKRFVSDTLGLKIKLRVATTAIKSVEIKGGLDTYLLNTKDSFLSNKARKLKKLLHGIKIQKIIDKQQ
ncbi:50S ribosomal protein L28 [Candidatus Sneabacter namystus]|uniref:Large ribosomal subunit protein bL28 n=1 Tax=Candidatus Sneabacter namystus TaxID=2601646 RepID=A0A5C0UHZ6_9RICK|nr:50S ribosomal protein L28 [Candidatus Sneabacter namystus]QEK39369.1 50S ribosomal protein L28 [Candidatus Sneabacter namystus]